MKNKRLGLMIAAIVITSLMLQSCGTSGPVASDVEGIVPNYKGASILAKAKCQVTPDEQSQGYKEKWIVKFELPEGYVFTHAMVYDGYTWKDAWWGSTGCPSLD